MKRLLIFASGAGSNAARILSFFRNDPEAEVAAVFTNRAQAGVIGVAEEANVPVVVFSREALSDGRVLDKIREIDPHLIILSGFLLQVPEEIVSAFSGRIVNIHPALLPKYGGAGMYGMHVHKAVFENKEKESGITIHMVNEHYDEGKIVFQQSVDIADCLSPEEVASRVQSLEHEHFPEIIRQILEA